ncbi:MAG: Gldg family protein [Pseudomonadota bacterium]
MILPAFLTILGYLAIFIGERTFGDAAIARWVFNDLGILAVLVATALRLRAVRSAEGNYRRRALQVTCWLSELTLVGLTLYVVGLDAVTDLVGLSEDFAHRWHVALNALWPILMFAGLVPLLLVDLAISASPLAPHPARVRDAVDNGLTLALAIALLFPLNYLAHEFNHRWDVAYFKTTEPGTATQNLVANLDQPIEVVLFFPTANDVGREVLPYFEALQSPNLTVEVLDHALAPVRAKDLKVRDNGNIAFIQGEQTETLKIGTDLDKARRTLKKLDSEVQKKLLALAKGERKAYFTAGHGELDWRGTEGPEAKISLLKKLLEALNYKVETLGIGEGLATAVPDDASIVFVVGPTDPFLPAEVQALEAYRAAGGSLFVALEPALPDAKVTGLEPLLATLGVTWSPVKVITDDPKTFLPIQGGIVDRQNLGTNRYSSHESVTTLSKNRQAAWLVFSGAGSFEETKEHLGKVTTTVRTLAQAWDDVNGDFEFQEGTESRKVRDLAVVASGPAAESAEYRAVIVGDAGFSADLLLPNKANAQFMIDATNWLLRDEAISGEVNDEEDVKIVHTKEGQGLWFYGTTFLVPFLLGLLGFLRVRSRRSSRKGVA